MKINIGSPIIIFLLIGLSSICIGQHIADFEGAIKVGESPNTNLMDGTIAWDGTHFKGWDGNNWIAFGSNVDVLPCDTSIRIDSLPFVIAHSGRYHLESDLVFNPSAPSKIGISIEAPNVLIELNGYSIKGSEVQGGFYGGTGISDSLSSNKDGFIQIQNGVLSNWSSTGINVCSVLSMSNVTVDFCGGYGISTGRQAKMSYCHSTNNLKSGFYLGPSVYAINCSANNNTMHGFDGYLFSATFPNSPINKTFIGCKSSNNELSGFSESGNYKGCESSGNAGHGFKCTSIQSNLIECLSEFNNDYGFYITNGTLVNCESNFNSVGFHGNNGQKCHLNQCTAENNTIGAQNISTLNFGSIKDSDSTGVIAAGRITNSYIEFNQVGVEYVNLMENSIVSYSEKSGIICQECILTGNQVSFNNTNVISGGAGIEVIRATLKENNIYENYGDGVVIRGNGLNPDNVASLFFSNRIWNNQGFGLLFLGGRNISFLRENVIFGSAAAPTNLSFPPNRSINNSFY